MIFTMFEYLIIFFSRILIYMWNKRYVMEILWQRLSDLSTYGGPEMTYSNAVGVMNSKWQSESDTKIQQFLNWSEKSVLPTFFLNLYKSP